MYTEVLQGIEGIGIFPAISLLLFVVVFGAVLIRVMRADSARLEAFAALPLDEPGEATDDRSDRRRALKA